MQQQPEDEPELWPEGDPEPWWPPADEPELWCPVEDIDLAAALDQLEDIELGLARLEQLEREALARFPTVYFC